MHVLCGLNQKTSHKRLVFSTCDPAGARTQDPNIKSVVLYLLSYRVNRYCDLRVQKYIFFSIGKHYFEKKFSSIQDSLALTHNHDLVFGAIHHRTGRLFACTAVNDDVHQVLVPIVDFFWIREIAFHLVVLVQ